MPKRKKQSTANISPNKASKRRKKDEDLGDGTWKVREVLDEHKEKGYLLQWEGINSQTGREYTPEWIPSKDVGPGLIADWENQKQRARFASPISEVADSLASSPRRSERSRKPSRRIIDSSPSTGTGSAPGSAQRLRLNLDDSTESAPNEPRLDAGSRPNSHRNQAFGGPLTSRLEVEGDSEKSSADTAFEDLASPSSRLRPFIAVPQPSQFDPAEYGSQPPTQYRSSQLEPNCSSIDTAVSPSIAIANITQESGSNNVGLISSSERTSSIENLSELVPDSQEIAETQPESLHRRFGDVIEGNTQRVLESSLLGDEGVDISIAAPSLDKNHIQSAEADLRAKEDSSTNSTAESSTTSPSSQIAHSGQEGSGQPPTTLSNGESQSSEGPSEDAISIDFTQGVINTSTSSGSQNGVSQGPSDFVTQLSFHPTQQANTCAPIQRSELNNDDDYGVDEGINQAVPETVDHCKNNRLPDNTEGDSASTDQIQVQRGISSSLIAQQITSSVIDQAVASCPRFESISSPLPPPSQSLERASDAPPRPQTPSTMATPVGGTPNSGRLGLTYGQRRALSRLEIYGEPLPANFPDQWRYLADDPSSITQKLEELQTAAKLKRDENINKASSTDSSITQLRQKEAPPTSEIPSPNRLSTGNDAMPDAIPVEQSAHGVKSKDIEVGKTESLRGEMNIYLPVTLTSDQRDLYLDTLRFHQKTIDDFLSSTNDNCSTELQDMARSVLERLHHFILHPDLLDDGSWTQQDEIPTQKAQWDAKASSKFKLLKAFFDRTCHSEKHIVILVEPGRVMDLVETFLKGIQISYFRPDQHRQFESTRGPLRVTLLQTGQQGSRNISSRAHLVIGLDATFSHEDPQVQQVRRHLLEVDRMCPVVSLVVVSSVEHIRHRLPKDLSDIDQMRMLLSQARELRGQVGSFTKTMPQPQEVGEAMAAALLSDGSDSRFLSSIQNIQLPLLDSMDGVSSAAQIGSGGKRQLSDIVSPSLADPPWKRPRTSTLLGDEGLPSPSINRISDSNIASTSAEAQAGELLDQKVAELMLDLEAANSRVEKSDARAKVADEKAASFEARWNAMKTSHDSLETAITDLQTRFEDLTREKQSLANQLSIAETAATGAQTSIDALRNNNAALKTERAQLRNELAEASKQQPVVAAVTSITGVPDTTESISAPSAPSEDTTTRLRKAEKRITSLTGEIEFLRSQYQSASTAAAESANTIANLQSENTTLQSRASDMASKLRAMYETEAVKRANGNATRLEREKQSLEKAIEKLSNENKRLKEKEQRLGMAANTRASSLPPGVAPPGLQASVRSALGARGGGGVGGRSSSKPGSRQGSRATSPGPGSNDKVGVGRGGSEKGGVEMTRSASHGSTSARTTGARIQLNLGRMSHLRE